MCASVCVWVCGMFVLYNKINNFIALSPTSEEASEQLQRQRQGFKDSRLVSSLPGASGPSGERRGKVVRKKKLSNHMPKLFDRRKWQCVNNENVFPGFRNGYEFNDFNFVQLTTKILLLSREKK